MILANSKSNLFLLGNGGHAGVILDMLTEIGVNVSAVYSPVAPVNSTLFADIEHRTSDQDILRYDPENTFLINGIGMLPNKDIRRNVFNRFNNHGYRFISVISPTAKISKHAIIGEGVQIFHNVTVQAGCKIGDHTILNTGVIVEHDCTIGSHNHFAPGTTICGGVETCENVFIGAGATILPNRKISASTVVRAQCVL